VKPWSPASRVESAISCWRCWPPGLLRPIKSRRRHACWQTTTLAEDFAVEDASEDDLYAAMDWLLQGQSTIEKKLAKRHLQPGGVVRCDLWSSYFECSTCPLAKRGLQSRWQTRISAGQLRSPHRSARLIGRRFCACGPTSDCETFLAEVQRLRQDFGIEQLVIVGDRGMKSIDGNQPDQWYRPDYRAQEWRDRDVDRGQACPTRTVR
jgi:hypothetical protein